MPDVVMPKLSDSMEEATILRWIRSAGETVSPGDELVEIETDKAVVIYEADDAGVLEIVCDAGETVSLGAIIARLVDGNVAETAVAGRGRRVEASPVARRVADEVGVDLSTIHGTGFGGRVTKLDVLAASAQAPGGLAPVRSPVTAAPAAAPRTEDLTRIQSVIAQRMSEAQRTIPDFQVTMEVDMRAAMDLRARLRSLGRPQPLSPNDFVVKACALALGEHPRLNATFADGKLEWHDEINVGVAVAADGALVVPVIHDADQLDLLAVAVESHRLAARVRDSTVTPAELEGGTFTVSNLGMYGVREFTAVINPPQAAILAVGEIAQRPVVRDGELAVATMMTLTLSSDHRIVYGAAAAAFLARVRALLQEPLSLLISA